jgi:hypothetical protein
MSRFLPKLFRWAFTVLAGLMALAAVGLVAVILADPKLPPGAHFGPVHGDVMGQPAAFALQPVAGGQEPILSLHGFNGNVSVAVDKPSGVIALLKRYGLPLLLLDALFFTALFEVLRRLFRNVGRGESFTPQSVRLVQIVGGALIVFSLVSSVGESWFAHAMYAYLVQHTQIAISGTPVHLPPAMDHVRWFRFRFDWALFSGLLVLALAEVFRQGLVLQRENDLTV